ncbi:alkaline phosphatase [Cohaesibacter celericrescens]|jgi:alkaline phosphatase|uniref:Alkaline phosphatase n=1 Tax=Cohaesibacter celericrescens TaxID=2067669 RepID=A0A2N5XVL7_9HYPH|nr:alkaline phosphatase [Cohaesibacter celericrescens]PLW78556.1 alkaline phosphatase [Cohaesibacter celericrescens]
MRSTLIFAMALTATTAASAQDLPDVQKTSDWFTAGETTIQELIAREKNTGRAKNVILMIADGNGIGTNYATRLYVGQQLGELGEEHVLPYETNGFYNGIVKTYNINAQTPDSAPTAGAMNTGVKQRFNTINLGGTGIHDDCSTVAGNELTTFGEIVAAEGKSVGIVTTARLTHATPAAVYSKTANRNWEDSLPEGCSAQKDIASQLVDGLKSGFIDIALGGGSRYFVPKGSTTPNNGKGHRKDGLDLLADVKAAGIQYASNKDEFDALDLSKPIFGMWTDSHTSYEADRPDTEPSLVDMTKKAIEFLSQNDEGYYLEVEAGRVDHANHAGNFARTAKDGMIWTEAVALADEMTDDKDTLIIVTADHEHAIAFNGYCGRGTPIQGLCYKIAKTGEKYSEELALADDGKPYSVIGYTNGSGTILKKGEGKNDFSGSRPEVTQEEAMDLDYLQQALIPMSSETHSGEDVAIYAKGPWAHLVDGTIEQNVIFHVMNHAAHSGK